MRLFWLIVFVAATTIIFYVFVFQQWYLVASTGGFITLVLIFAVLSFFSSAIETAFSSAHTDKRIQEQLATDAEEIAKRYEKFDNLIREGTSLVQFSASQRRELKKLERADRRFKRKRASLEEASRSLYVGTFTSLSVFLNIALTAMLPYAMVSQPQQIDPIGFSFVKWFYATPEGIKFVWASIDASGQKVLIFCASAFPILVFGKIVPKEFGALFNYFFAYRLNWWARKAVIAIGIIPMGLQLPLSAIRKRARKANAA